MSSAQIAIPVAAAADDNSANIVLAAKSFLRQQQQNNSPSLRIGEGLGGGDRTLTNLYNALNVWHGVEKINVTADAADFAPRLDDLHRALDEAVCDAYAWPPAILDDDEAILRRLLALNLERAGAVL